jgi:hypothetical protein
MKNCSGQPSSAPMWAHKTCWDNPSGTHAQYVARACAWLDMVAAQITREYGRPLPPVAKLALPNLSWYPGEEALAHEPCVCRVACCEGGVL